MVGRCLALASVIVAAIAISAAPAMALSSSQKVLLIPNAGPAAGTYHQDGIMPTSTSVAGRPSESFGKFSFTSLGSNSITPSELSKFDTVALIQVNTSTLPASAKAALAQFVANGGKLLIHDSDETKNNDYSWLLPNSSPTQVGASCNNCGLMSGSSQITENTGLISANPADPTYVNVPELQKFTDAIGDANLLTSLDSRWFTAAKGTNGNSEAGAQIAYATSGTGLVVYNGFDTDMIMPSDTSPWRCLTAPPNYQCTAQTGHMSVDWLAQMWYNELNKSWGSSGSGLPQSTPVSTIGTPLPPSQAGLPPVKACVAKHKFFIRLKKLVRLHRKVVRIDVYVNGHHRLVERRRHFHNVTLRRLPKKGAVTIKIVATTNRHYHLIIKRRYRAC